MLTRRINTLPLGSVCYTETLTTRRLTALHSLYAEVAADGTHGGLGRLGGPQHLAPLEHNVHSRPHHAHHGARSLGTNAPASPSVDERVPHGQDNSHGNERVGLGGARQQLIYFTCKRSSGFSRPCKKVQTPHVQQYASQRIARVVFLLYNGKGGRQFVWAQGECRPENQTGKAKGCMCSSKKSLCRRIVPQHAHVSPNFSHPGTC